MATVGERLAALESTARVNREKIDELLELINGGPHVEWEQSIRGRLHTMQNDRATANALAEALREVRRDRARQWATWQKIGLFLFAAMTTAASVVAALHAVVGG